jgi:FdhD protein
LASNIKQVFRWSSDGQSKKALDELAVEEPLEIRVDTRSVSVTMRTPGHDDELVAGFLVSEGLIKQRKDVLSIKPHPRNSGQNIANVFLSPSVSVDFARLTRHFIASSSCGLCGKASIETVHHHFKPVRTKLAVDASVLLGLPQEMRRRQHAFNRTGGLHAAAAFDARGRLVVLREDVGRHNAVDKVIGFGFLRNPFPFDAHVLMVSGRASFEIMQKALAARIPIVCAVSAPSNLAVEFARESGQTLVGFLRGESMNIYSHPKRILRD